MNIRALAFDTGGTVLDWHGRISDVLRRAGQRRGVEADWAAVTNAYRREAMQGIVGQRHPSFVVDADGVSLAPGVTGELVMRTPSIGLTRGLWHDRERYLQSYWSRLPNLWVHGDFASRDAEGMWYVHGRSDDTLKIAGKRTDPAEIEGLLMGTGLLLDAVAVGTPDPIKGTAVVCVCVPRPGVGSQAVDTLSSAVVAGLGGAFRPARVVFVSDVPRTRNMKVMRRVVRAAWLGEAPGDLSTLVNPESVQAIRTAAEGKA